MTYKWYATYRLILKYSTRQYVSYVFSPCLIYIGPNLQGRSKRSGWSGHGRTNNRAGKFYFIFLIFLNFLLYFFGRNNNRAGIFFDIIFETETTQSPKCALWRFDFRPFPSIPCRQSSSFDGWERPPGARVRWPLPRPSMRRRAITAVVTYVFFRLNLPLNKFRRQCYKFRRQWYKFRRQCYGTV